MTDKELRVSIYNYLVADSSLMSLMGLTGLPAGTIQDRIVKTRQLSNVADRFPRIAIYELKPTPQNRKVHSHRLVVDIVVPLETQTHKGLAFDMVGRVKAVLKGRSVCMSFRWETTLEDQRTAYGWYRTSVLFTYDKVET